MRSPMKMKEMYATPEPMKVKEVYAIPEGKAFGDELQELWMKYVEEKGVDPHAILNWTITMSGGAFGVLLRREQEEMKEGENS